MRELEYGCKRSLYWNYLRDGVTRLSPGWENVLKPPLPTV